MKHTLILALIVSMAQIGCSALHPETKIRGGYMSWKNFDVVELDLQPVELPEQDQPAHHQRDPDNHGRATLDQPLFPTGRKFEDPESDDEGGEVERADHQCVQYQLHGLHFPASQISEWIR